MSESHQSQLNTKQHAFRVIRVFSIQEMYQLREMFDIFLSNSLMVLEYLKVSLCVYIFNTDYVYGTVENKKNKKITNHQQQSSF